MRLYYQQSVSFSDADYWATLLHELVHASGHAKRLNREGITSSLSRFGDPIYAFEELIAELGSAFLCAELGVYGEVQHESYFASWLKTLKEDKHAIFRASRQAREACEFYLTLLRMCAVQWPDALNAPSGAFLWDLEIIRNLNRVVCCCLWAEK